MDYAANVLQAGDLGQEVFCVARQVVHLQLLLGAERRTNIELGNGLGSEYDAAYLGKHGGDLYAPGVFGVCGLDHLADDPADTGGTSESERVGQAQVHRTGAATLPRNVARAAPVPQ